jgi:hypothetical protein
MDSSQGPATTFHGCGSASKRRSRAGGRLVLVRFDSLVDVWLDDCSVADSTNIGGRVLALDDPLDQPDARQPGRPQAGSLLLRSSAETRWRVTPKCSAICSIVRPSS